MWYTNGKNLSRFLHILVIETIFNHVGKHTQTYIHRWGILWQSVQQCENNINNSNNNSNWNFHPARDNLLLQMYPKLTATWTHFWFFLAWKYSHLCTFGFRQNSGMNLKLFEIAKYKSPDSHCTTKLSRVNQQHHCHNWDKEIALIPSFLCIINDLWEENCKTK